MNNRVLEAIEKGPQFIGKLDPILQDRNLETDQEFALRIAKLCGEVAAGVCDRVAFGDPHTTAAIARNIIRSEFDLGGNDGR